MSKTIKPGTRVERGFAFDRAAVNEEARTVELAFSSEQPYERWWGIEILDHDKKSVQLGRINSGGPLLCDHDVRDHVGVIESVRIDDDRVGRAVVRFGKSARAEEVWQDVKDGIRRNVSVGYVINDAVLEKTGKDSADTYRIKSWEPYEISLVSCPADWQQAGIGRAAGEESPIIPFTKEQTMEQQTPAPVDTAAIESRAADVARQAELRRVNDILTIGADHDATDLARAAVKDNMSVADFQAKLLEAKRDAQGAGKELHYGQAARSKDNITDDPKRGFRSYGDFAAAVMRSASDKGMDERLVRAASTYANEASGPDGGYAVPPEFATEIASVAYGEESLLARCDTMSVSGNTMSFPKDETTPWGSTGITAAWESEGNQTTPKKPALGESTLKLRKLKVLVAASDELLADAAGMTSYLTRKCGEAVEWKITDAIVNGTGTGMPLGILNAGSLVAQAKEGSQTADTIVAGNIAKMYGRCIMGAGANVVWLMNPDCFQQVMQLSLNSNPIWVPANQGFAAAPNGLLMGRPIVLTDACDTVGDQGDIILANMSGYRAITKAGGAEFATSMHLWFDQDLMAFRLIFRMDGQPTLTSAVTPPNSAITRSHFVALAART